MHTNRPHILSIAGFDPSAGAGVLADIKTFEANHVYGMGVVSALTYQNDSTFQKVEWIELSRIIEQIEVLKKRFKFEFIKIGLIENIEVLSKLIAYLKSDNSHPKIVWDPILKASAGFEFYQNNNQQVLEDVCKNIYLVTPNMPEALALASLGSEMKNAKYLSQYCNVYLKGGHNEDQKGVDFLFSKNQQETILPNTSADVSAKHGSGCVLSSTITANLAKGLTLDNACWESKKYISDFLSSNDTLLGYHLTNETRELKIR